MDRKRGDSGDVTQQWQEVTSDQHRLARRRSSEPTNIPAEEINMKHKQSRSVRARAQFRVGYTPARDERRQSLQNQNRRLQEVRVGEAGAGKNT